MGFLDTGSRIPSRSSRIKDCGRYTGWNGPLNCGPTEISQPVGAISKHSARLCRPGREPTARPRGKPGFSTSESGFGRPVPYMLMSDLDADWRAFTACAAATTEAIAIGNITAPRLDRCQGLPLIFPGPRVFHRTQATQRKHRRIQPPLALHCCGSWAAGSAQSPLCFSLRTDFCVGIPRQGGSGRVEQMLDRYG